MVSGGAPWLPTICSEFRAVLSYLTHYKHVPLRDRSLGGRRARTYRACVAAITLKYGERIARQVKGFSRAPRVLPDTASSILTSSRILRTKRGVTTPLGICFRSSRVVRRQRFSSRRLRHPRDALASFVEHYPHPSMNPGSRLQAPARRRLPRSRLPVIPAREKPPQRVDVSCGARAKPASRFHTLSECLWIEGGRAHRNPQAPPSGSSDPAPPLPPSSDFSARSADAIVARAR